ncbi:MAG: hypothetical protein CVU54_14520 [Deltaproteobacteria bacterium HGW-Deltaproteobacteria-12]|jgi:hypothetical protein|nr:MAG: hypothetical protein CVU54_14520 [Deltaproteobacteria bacterium HGW-Deltaproteobacteria-12]
MKKICSKCFREFTEDDQSPGPAEVLGQLYLDMLENQDARGICPECREEHGILNLLGFDQ